MKNILKLEEAAQFLFGIYLFAQLNLYWWWFPLLIFVPDLSMLGYLMNAKWGAWFYNFGHHKGIAIATYLAGIYTSNAALLLSGIILFSHSALDRVLGYGLKFETSFGNTHLGRIGKN